MPRSAAHRVHSHNGDCPLGVDASRRYGEATPIFSFACARERIPPAPALVTAVCASPKLAYAAQP